MEFIVRKSYVKSRKRLDQIVKEKVKERLYIFEKDPNHSSLYNHGLKGRRSWCRSINVTGDIRIIFRELSDGAYELVELVNVGTHSQLYG